MAARFGFAGGIGHDRGSLKNLDKPMPFNVVPILAPDQARARQKDQGLWPWSFARKPGLRPEKAVYLGHRHTPHQDHIIAGAAVDYITIAAINRVAAVATIDGVIASAA